MNKPMDSLRSTFQMNIVDSVCLTFELIHLKDRGAFIGREID